MNLRNRLAILEMKRKRNDLSKIAMQAYESGEEAKGREFTTKAATLTVEIKALEV